MEEYIFMSRKGNEIKKEYFKDVKNASEALPIKPEIGTCLWASIYTPEEDYLSEWHEFVCNEMESILGEYESIYKFKLKPDAKIFTIDSRNDLYLLLSEYKLDNPKINYKTAIDFEKISKDYDAIHLTSNGQINTRFGDYDLYGWDVDSLLVLNFDCIDTNSIVKME